MRKSRSQSRYYALQALYQWQLTADPVEDIQQYFLSEQGMTGADRAYFKRLVRGVVHGVGEVDAQLAPVLDRKVAMVDPVELAILRLGVYELLYRPNIPPKVVINEAVVLAKCFGAEQGHRYINGVLDRVARNMPEKGLGEKG